MIKKIDHINVVVKDLEKAKRFFLDLGFFLQHEGVLEGEWIDRLMGMRNVKAEYAALTLSGGETNLELLHFICPDNLTTWDNYVPNKTGYRHLAFEVENIEAFVTELKAKDVKFMSEIQEYKPSKKKLCYFYGPEGIMLELAEYEK
jgi:catechol 2,3-dioxygenase-like lactoylglutathione lyase family enzyme